MSHTLMMGVDPSLQRTTARTTGRKRLLPNGSPPLLGHLSAPRPPAPKVRAPAAGCAPDWLQKAVSSADVQHQPKPTHVSLRTAAGCAGNAHR